MAKQSAPRPTRKPPRQYHHGDLRRALLEAAVRAIQRHGIEGLTLRAVGADLGVSRSALYRHFADKDALLTAVAAEGFRTLHQNLANAWQAGGRGRMGFEAIGVAYVRFALESPLHYRIMFGGGFERDFADPDLAREGAAAFQVLVDSIVEQQRAGLVRADDPILLADFVWAQVHGLAMLGIDGPLLKQGVDLDQLARFAVERLRTGIAAEAREAGERAPAGEAGPPRPC